MAMQGVWFLDSRRAHIADRMPRRLAEHLSLRHPGAKQGAKRRGADPRIHAV